MRVPQTIKTENPLRANSGRRGFDFLPPASPIDRRLLAMHQVMLGDRVRVDAYDRSLAQVIKPGDVVADVGAGMLILSMLALRHGAGHVYAIEGDPQVAALARCIAERNSLKNKLTLIQGDARSVRLPCRADVIVSEMMGNLGPEEEMADVVGAFADRNLAPHGRIVPERLQTYVQAIEFDDEGWGVWQKEFRGYSLEVVQDYAETHAQMHFFRRAPVLLSDPAIVFDARFDGADSACETVRTLDIVSAGRMHAIIGYFRATLAAGIELTNFPSYPGCNWAVWAWPVRHTTVAPGDVIRVEIQSPANVRNAVEWRLDCRMARRTETS